MSFFHKFTKWIAIVDLSKFKADLHRLFLEGVYRSSSKTICCFKNMSHGQRKGTHLLTPDKEQPCGYFCSDHNRPVGKLWRVEKITIGQWLFYFITIGCWYTIVEVSVLLRKGYNSNPLHLHMLFVCQWVVPSGGGELGSTWYTLYFTCLWSGTRGIQAMSHRKWQWPPG